MLWLTQAGPPARLGPVSPEDQRAATGMLRRLLAAVEGGSLDAQSAHASRLVRRLEGALIALEVQVAATEPAGRGPASR